MASAGPARLILDSAGAPVANRPGCCRRPGLLPVAAVAAAASLRPAADPRRRPSASAALQDRRQGRTRPPADLHCQTPAVGASASARPRSGPRTASTSVNATGAGRTIVIVDAFQSPTIRHDLDAVRPGLRAARRDRAHRRAGRPDPVRPERRQPGRLGRRDHARRRVGARGRPGARRSRWCWRSRTTTPTSSRATQFAVDHNLGDVISQSLRRGRAVRGPGASSGQQHAMFAKATLKGITLLASSGDQGAAQPSCDGTTFIKAASSPASDPFVTGVGGTCSTPTASPAPTTARPRGTSREFEAATGGGFSVRLPHADLPEAAAPARRAACRTSPTTPASTPACCRWSSSGLGQDLVFRLRRHERRLPAVGRADRAWRPRLPARPRRLPQPAGLRAVAGQAGLRRAVPRHHHGRQLVHRRRRPGDPVSIGLPGPRGWDPATGLGTPKANELVPVSAASCRSRGTTR